jgi:ribonucleotide reductase alpha subunit
MKVQKRNGDFEAVSFDKVLQRLRVASKGLSVNPDALAQQVLSRIVNKIHTSELDELAAASAASLCTTHPDWGTLASRIAISNHQKNTEADFSKVIKTLSNQTHKNGSPLSYVSDELVDLVSKHGTEIDAYMKHERDNVFDYFGFKTLEKSYLLKDTNMKIVERPQHMWMRVALGIWGSDLKKAFETYDLLSLKYMTHATPTLFNAGTPRPQLSSCYLLSMADDSIAGIYKTLGDCAAISKYAGGIGLHLHNIRARGSLIRGTNGTSNGIIPMLRVFNNTARYVDQCFRGDANVLTRSGPVEISSIRIGDYVLTSGCIESVDESGKYFVDPNTSGVWCRVNKVVEHVYDGKILKVKTNAGTVRVTPSHPVLAFKSYDLDYIEIGKLSVGDKIRSYDKNGTPFYNTIVSIEDDYFDGILYDLEIERTHDYVVCNLGVAHNGGGKRNGSFAMYLEPWHADVEDFLRMKLNTGAEEERARDLFYALWIPDLFMERVEADSEWSLFCPDEAPGLSDVYGDEFKALYTRYEAEGRAKKVVSARKLWFQTLDSQMETGTPYLLYKDAANAKSNQKNLGTIKSSNLCTEIIEYSSPEETAVCNLASIALSSYIVNGAFDFETFRATVRKCVQNLNKVIDINFYPTVETKRSNMRHRPIGIGVQGLADVFAMLKLGWETDEAAALNQLIFEHMYYAALDESAEIALVEGPYETFDGSPASKGVLQPDMWGIKPLSENLDWDTLRVKVSKGIRNSLLVAPMPTASTSQILGSNECFEPFTSNLYTRRTLAGEYIVLNKHLMRELIELGLWNDALKQQIVLNNGSVQAIMSIPEAVRLRYKTSWEIPQKVLIDMAAARGAFICQSQSLNLFMADPTYTKLTSMHFYAWKKGLKTGCYYLRTKAPVSAQKFTVDPRLLAAISGTPVTQDDGPDSDFNDSSDDEEEAVREETRAEKLERLSREYEEEVAKAKAATEAGEGCLHCSA